MREGDRRRRRETRKDGKKEYRFSKLCTYIEGEKAVKDYILCTCKTRQW